MNDGRWILYMIAAFVVLIACMGVWDINNMTENEKDCSDRQGQMVFGGRNGDDFCIYDGKIVKVYK